MTQRPLRYRSQKGKCPTGKRRYPTAIDAGLALSHAQSKRRLDGEAAVKVESRHYPCPQCKGHHLTSEPRRS